MKANGKHCNKLDNPLIKELLISLHIFSITFILLSYGRSRSKLSNQPVMVRKIKKGAFFGTGFLVLALTFWVLSLIKNKQNKQNYLLVIRCEHTSEKSSVKVKSINFLRSFHFQSFPPITLVNEYYE